MHRIFLLIALILTQSGNAQPPSNLTTDLLEHTDRVFLDGYLTTLSLPETRTAIERYQVPAIRNAKPCLGWVMNNETPNTVQTAYRILMASSWEKLIKDEADVWDSRKTESNNSIAVRYDGRALEPSTVYYWKVKTWDNHGQESVFSPIKSFITASKLDGKTATYPLQITDEYPVQLLQDTKTRTFVDFGRAAFGKLKLTLSSKTGTDTVIVHLGEHSNGSKVDRKPGGTIRYAVYKLPLMAGQHTYTIKFRPDPRNTLPKGNESGVDPVLMPGYIGEVYPFRYCELENYSGKVKDQDVVRQSVHYPFNDNAATFYSSDSVLNKVWELCKYSIKATSFLGVYVDGDRERIPYEADALINQMGHYYTDREFSMARHSNEYLIYNATWPTEWNLQTLIMAWADYMHTGNRQSITKCYDDLRAKTLMALKEENGLISSRTGKLSPEFYKSIHFKGKNFRDIVDWPQTGIVGAEKQEPGESDGYVMTTYNTVVNAYHYEALQLMSRIAGVLGNIADQQLYRAEAEKVKKQFNALLLNVKTGIYKDGIDTEHSSLHANMFPMAFGMVPEKNRQAVSDFIKSRKMACSVYGSHFLLEAIYNANDAAYGLELLASTMERSWYNMIRVGSTVTLEAWDNKYKPNQDWNHAWGAAPAHLIPRRFFGIEPIEPGFSKVRIRPQPAGVKEAAIKVPTIRGDITALFTNQPGESFLLEVNLPANTTGEIWLPLTGKKSKLLLDGKERQFKKHGAFAIINAGSGKHSLIIKNAGR
ncbi:alpha-L-rhamnosidase C-terminal domain-containing protein [Niabella yanshanensis]|uniref:alpha-L-rhamnosidase n=1 Tax=Niabella yanshanensis TaxID=577386 RepID=A0ABZ0W3K8_9BACT|nr:alpha-L-rhamnosidase C-terminal domain-containing protein [Niabella yanshanensis]WQD37822.1 alpha-L-rhamnosidase C-terminal domain-containing protein [Niabella yanshanensis]